MVGHTVTCIVTSQPDDISSKQSEGAAVVHDYFSATLAQQAMDGGVSVSFVCKHMVRFFNHIQDIGFHSLVPKRIHLNESGLPLSMTGTIQRTIHLLSL